MPNPNAENVSPATPTVAAAPAMTSHETPTLISGTDIYKTFLPAKRKRSPKNAKVLSSLVKSPAQPIATNNRFGALDQTGAGNSGNSQESTMKTEKPTPLFVRGSVFVNMLPQFMSSLGISKFDARVLRNGQEGKLQLFDIADYRKVQAMFTSEKIPYFTFQLKSERALRVALKGLHPDTKPDDIKRELGRKNFAARSVTNVVNRRGEKSSVFMIDLDPKSISSTGPHPIYQLNRFMHMVVQVEEPHKIKQPLRCHNCQEYGHTKSRCNLLSICALCSGRHSTLSCEKDRNDPNSRKCNNCGGQHAASWKGCAVYREFKERMNPRQSRGIKNQRFNRNERIKDPNEATGRIKRDQISYADIAKNKNTNNIDLLQIKGDSDVIKLMILMQSNISALQANMAEIIKNQSKLEESVSQLSKMVTRLMK